MVDEGKERLPQRKQDSGLISHSEATHQDALMEAISKLSPEDQAEVRRKLVDEQIRLAVKQRESTLDVDIFDDKARKVIGVARELSRDPTTGFRVEAVHETKEGNTRVVVSRGCINIVLVLVLLVVLLSSIN